MATTYNWNCRTVEAHQNFENKSNVVYKIHWIVTATSTEKDADGEFYTADSIGVQSIDTSNISDFIPSEELTNDILVGWTKVAMGEDHVLGLETSLNSKLDEIVSPRSITIIIED